MSRLNPNAGEFVPSFSTPAIAVNTAAAAPLASSSLGTTEVDADKAPFAATTNAAMASEIVAMTGEDAVPYDAAFYGGFNGRWTYSNEFLLAFQSLCYREPAGIPDIVRAPTPTVPKIGKHIKGRLVYTVAELLQFQPLYQMMPEDFTLMELLATNVMGDKKSKSKSAKQKDKNRLRADESMAMHYDSSLVCYFNPNEYAAAMGLYTGPPDKALDAAAATAASGSDLGNGRSAAPNINPIEEAVNAKRRLATLLDDVGPETVSSILESFVEITITCTHTLQEVIGLLFDHAIAEPSLCDSYAQLCTGISEKTPEFKEGAKTINFRRILLTKCYEALIEEPEVPQQSGKSQKGTATNTKAGGGNIMNLSQHSWRRRCMLRNVGFIGELFRRQLLTENIMHVCVAMMLEDEVTPHGEIIEAACQLLSLVGDLLDGSSPASRRTMDEYFAVLQRLQSHALLPGNVKEHIADMITLRAGGWIKKRLEASATASIPAVIAVRAGASTNATTAPANHHLTPKATS